MIIFDLFEDNNKKTPGVTLAEFAPSDSSNGDDGFSEETLKQLAAQWYNGDEDPEVERTLEVAGWEIGQVEDDDEPGVFVVQAGDVNGNSYISWPADELRQGISEGEFTISDDPAAHIKLLFLKTINGNEYRLVKQGNVYNIYINRSRKSKQEFSSFDLAKRALQQLLLNAVHSDQQGVTEAEGPGRVDPILYKALARMTKGGYDDAKIALAIEFGLLDMKHNYAIANNYIPKLVDLYNQKHGVAEARKKKKKKSSKSLGRYFFPGYGYYGGGESGEGGGDGGGGESVNRGATESLEDHERYQYIVTLKSGKRIRFLCGEDCDVKTYIERKYNEPVVDIKDQGIVGEPPVELLPGEMKRGELNELAPAQQNPRGQEGKISAELRKLRAQYPDARSDLEAVAIGGQEAHDDARKHLARVDDIVSKLDRAADQLQSVNVDQDSELNILDRENNDLEKQVKDLEQRIDQLKQPRSKAADQPTQARSTEPNEVPDNKTEPAKSTSQPKSQPAKTSEIDPDDLPPAKSAELKQKATKVAQLAQQNPEKFAKKTTDELLRDIMARKTPPSKNNPKDNPRDNISPDEMDMIQKMVAKASTYKEPYQPSAKEVAKAAEKTKTQADLFRQYNDMAQSEPVTEVSPEYVERYKKEHGRRATAADQAGDYAKGHEHFKKINKLTKKQFQRDAKPEKVDEISNFMTLAPKPVAPEEQWKRQIRLLAKQYQANASSLAALAREKGPDSAEAVAYEYLRDPSKIRIPGAPAQSSAVNWDDVIRRLPMGLSGMALLQAAEEYLTNTKGMLRSTVRNLLNNDENQRSLSAAYAKKNVPTESVTEDSDNEAVEQAIIRRIMVGRTDLLLKYGPKKVMQAVEVVADYVGQTDEIGSSDVSGWVKLVERILSRR